jgi:hypothetical protein
MAHTYQPTSHPDSFFDHGPSTGRSKRVALTPGAAPRPAARAGSSPPSRVLGMGAEVVRTPQEALRLYAVTTTPRDFPPGRPAPRPPPKHPPPPVPASANVAIRRYPVALPPPPFCPVVIHPNASRSAPQQRLVMLQTAATTFTTTVKTLTATRSHLAAYLEESPPQADLHIFLDRPSSPYTHILGYLRSLATSSSPGLPQGCLGWSIEALRHEADYLGMKSLVSLCDEHFASLPRRTLGRRNVTEANPPPTAENIVNTPAPTASAGSPATSDSSSPPYPQFHAL